MKNHAAFIFLLIVHLSCICTLSAEQRIYRIATIPWAGWSPLQVAQEKGFWDKFGVHVEIEYFSDGETMHDAIFTGQVDFAMNMVGTAIDWYFQVKPDTILAETDWSHGGDKLIIKKGVKLSDLKGSHIGVYIDGTALSYFLEKYLEKQGLSVSDFKLVKIFPENLVDQFVVGRLSAIVIFDPLSFRAVSEGNGEVLVSSAEIEGSIPECIYTFSSYLETIPEQDVVAILAGWIKAADWLNQPKNQPEYFRILNEKTFKDNPEYNDAQLTEMVSAVKIHDSEELCRANRDASGIYHYLETVNQMIRQNKINQKEIKVDQIYNNRFILKALELTGHPCN